MKLGILLVNQKMKLKLEVMYLEKTLDESNKSLFDKIKSMFKKNSYSKLKKELKVKKDYLEFIDKYMKENKEKMDMMIDNECVLKLTNKNIDKVKEELKNM